MRIGRNKKVAIAIGAVAVLLVVGGIGTTAYQHHQAVEAKQAYDARIDKKVSGVEAQYLAARKQNSDNKRLTGLKDVEAEYKRYLSGKEKDKKVIASYKSYIAKEKKYFADSNQDSLKSITLDSKQLAQAKKEDIQERIEDVDAQSKLISASGNIVYTDQQLKALLGKFDGLKKHYNAQLDKIKQKEEAAAKAKAVAASAASSKAAATVAANAQQQAQAQTQNAQGTVSGNGSATSQSQPQVAQSGTGYTAPANNGGKIYNAPAQSQSAQSSAQAGHPSNNGSHTDVYRTTREGGVSGVSTDTYNADGSITMSDRNDNGQTSSFTWTPGD